VLFDNWGTIVQNGVFPSPIKQVRYILRIHTPFPEYVHKFEKSFMTQEFENLTEAFENVIKEFELTPPRFVVDKLVGMWNKNALLAQPFEDTIPTFDLLKEKGIKIVLVSNTDRFASNQVLDKFNLKPYFDEIFLSCNEGLLKSDPELFDRVCDQLGLGKDEVLMVGDSMESDIEGAKNAGIRGILVDRKDKREYEDKVTELNQIVEYLGE
ncbi:HAD family hydrolase, partial [Candidatus Woesearchaeota archaeon]|nr:HAD family hydrolase [Candidatus Woesearchaeota archaeon]